VGRAEELCCNLFEGNQGKWINRCSSHQSTTYCLLTRQQEHSSGPRYQDEHDNQLNQSHPTDPRPHLHPTVPFRPCSLPLHLNLPNPARPEPKHHTHNPIHLFLPLRFLALVKLHLQLRIVPQFRLHKLLLNRLKQK
jgi:hypothetical protein